MDSLLMPDVVEVVRSVVVWGFAFSAVLLFMRAR
jgi:hypothetical protein